MSQNNNDPLSARNIIAGLLITVVAGVILAFIIQDARFDPSRTSPGFQGSPQDEAHALLRQAMQWEPKFMDTFDDNRHGWLVPSHSDDFGSANLSISGGKYVWEVTSNTETPWWVPPRATEPYDWSQKLDHVRSKGLLGL